MNSGSTNGNRQEQLDTVQRFQEKTGDKVNMHVYFSDALVH